MNAPLTMIESVTDEDIDWVCRLMKLDSLDVPRRDFLKSLNTVDVSACPGSGKTTLVVAKLAILARNWRSNTRGICVLSHTNVAREEIEHRLGRTDVGQRLLSYPHFIGTIHGFVTRFLTQPWVRSAGYPFTAMDNLITARVRRSALTNTEYRSLNYFLEQRKQSFDNLRLGSPDFLVRLLDPRTDETKDFPAGPDAPTHLIAKKALQHSTARGFFCYDETFVLGEALLAQQADVPGMLCHRFPFVLIDEMQDTSTQQNSLLLRLFPRDSERLCVQRVGDPNQAIFEGGTRPIADRFPDMDRCIGIANSFRFDASIAALAAPFAHAPVMPAGLKGVRATDASGHGLPHTIFVFPDDDASMVLDAFGRHVLACAPPALIGTSAIAAIGAVHKPFEDVLPGHRHYPKTVPHYWAGYQPHAGKQAYHPRTLVEYFHSARAITRNGGPVHQAIDGVAFGVIHLANLLAGVAHVKAPARRHLHIEQQLRDDSEVRAIYRDAVTRFLIDRETLTRDQWVVLCPRLKMLGATLSGADPDTTVADDFLTWRDAAVLPIVDFQAQTRAAATNIYQYAEGNSSVNIRLGSIHLAKGQTHLATLVLETFSHSHFLDDLMPWLLGKNQNGVKCKTDKATQRLLQVYVAMTRPTHLLCMALRRGSFGSDDEYAAGQEKLTARGWRIQELRTPT